MNDLVHFSFPLEDVISRLTDLKVTYDTMTLLYIVSIIVNNRFNRKAYIVIIGQSYFLSIR